MDGPELEAVVVDREDDEGCLEPSLADRLSDEGGVLADEPQPDVRVALAEVSDEVGDQESRRGAVHAEGQRPAAKLAHLANSVACAPDALEHLRRLGAKRTPRLGERDTATGADEEVDSELGLQLPHLLGQRRLGDVERAGCCRERAVLGGGEEVAELLESHSLYL